MTIVRYYVVTRHLFNQMKDKITNLTIDNRFRNPFHWGKFRYEPDYKVLTRADKDFKDTKRVYGVIYYKTWNPFEDNNLVIFFLFFHHWKKNIIFKVNK